jgi:hypothetical protein
MKRLLFAAFCLLLFSAQQARVASDFEIAQMERQLVQSHDFLAQLSGRLNLGDVRLARNESSLAVAEYQKALDLAGRERLDARRASQMTRYATATSYAALAEAKLSHDARAFELAEEALRYTSDSAKTWNLYSSTMSLLHKPGKAVSAARNAVTIATSDVAKSPTMANRLDLAIDQYALATALGEAAEAEELLQTAIASLKSDAFASLRSSVVSHESFEVYSSARGDEAAYVSTLNRAQLRLGALYESRGQAEKARVAYEGVLAGRSDDPTALAALARLARTDAERERYYAEAFDANPFSVALIRDYQRYLDRAQPAAPDESTTGGQVRLVLQQLHAGEERAARATLDALLAKFPQNDALRMLRGEAEERASGVPAFLTSGAPSARPTARELRQLVATKELTPEQRMALDRVVLESTVVFAKPFESGTIEGVPFRFPEPTTFNGTFSAGVPLRLTYRVLGTTDVNGADGLLLEPIRLQEIR